MRNLLYLYLSNIDFMLLLLVILAFVCCFGMRFMPYNEDYISFGATKAIKGVFAVFILFSHMNSYIMLQNGLFDNSFSIILKVLGQLMVAPYLFFSGYGILESLKRKPAYAASFPRKRLLKTLLNFDIAILFYLSMSIITGTHYPAINYVMCWIGWKSVGNSAWFIFVILALYLLTFISMAAAGRVRGDIGKKLMVTTVLTTALSIILWGWLRAAGTENYWHDTILCFPLGMWFSLHRTRFEDLMKVRRTSWMVLLPLIMVLVAWRILVGNDPCGISACLFCLAIVAISTKVRIGNTVLEWLGTHSFALYIMQRLPMNLLEHLGWSTEPYLFALLTIPSALIIAWAFNKLISRIDAQLGL